MWKPLRITTFYIIVRFSLETIVLSKTKNIQNFREKRNIFCKNSHATI